MARWRTLNKRARRKRERDAEFVRNLDKLLAPALEAIMKDAFRAAFAELAHQIDQIAAAWAKAVERLSTGWGPLDPKYARLRPRIEQWPDVVLEDILDAEYIEDWFLASS